MKKLLSLSMMVLVAISLGGLLTACDSGKTCGDGTVSQGGKCVPVCPAGQYWDDTACADIPACGAGTTFNADTGDCEPDSTVCAAGTELVGGECVPACGTGEYWDADASACAAIPECGAGTTFNQATGECDPDISNCAPGTSLVDGECQPDVICGEGTHADAEGNCVPNVLPDPDVTEDPEGAVFDLAAEDASVTLGGVIDTPVDGESNWDVFVFSADAGTYLDIWATSEGATLPAFVIFGFFDEDDEPDYQRIGLNPNGMDVEREVYLPFDGTYVLQITDYNNLVPALLGTNGLPVGGPDFSYYVEITTLPAPVPTALDATALDSTPITETGDFNDGSLKFYSVTNLPAELVNASTMGGAGVGTTLLVFNPDGSLKTESDNSLFMGAAGEYLIVQDFTVVVGPERTFQMDLATVPTPDCSTEDCTSGSFEENGQVVYLFDLLANDVFFHYATIVGDGSDIQISIMDLDGNEIYFGESYDTGFFGIITSNFSMWVPMDMSVIVRISGYEGTASSFSQEILQVPESYLTDGTTTGLVTWEPMGYYPAGIDQFEAQAGDVVFFTDYNLIDPTRAWSSPVTLLMGTDLATMFSAYDTSTGDLYDPPFITPKADGRFIHWLMDNADGAMPGTYDLTLTHQSAMAMAAPTEAATPTTGNVALNASSLHGVLSIPVAAGQGYKIEIVDSQDTLTPTVDVFAYTDDEGFNPAGEIPGLIASAAAAAPRADTGWFQAPYDGDVLVVTHDASGTAGGDEVLDVTMTMSACPYLATRCGNDGSNDIVEICDGEGWVTDATCDANCVSDANGGHCYVAGDFCADAIEIDLSGGDTTVDGDTTGMSNSFNDFSACTSYSGAGDSPDVWYTVTLDADASLTFEVLSGTNGDSLLALFDDCGNMYTDCDDDGGQGLLSALTADLSAGTYYLLVDFYGTTTGPFQLGVTINN